MENNDQIHDQLIELELAKNNSTIKNLLPGVVLVASIYYSSMLLLGLVIGYFASKLFAKYLLEKGKVNKIYIDCGKWKIHMHHWILGAIFLAIAWVIDYFYLPRFFIGLVCGIIAHDIYDFNDWHKVLEKNEEYKEKK